MKRLLLSLATGSTLIASSAFAQDASISFDADRAIVAGMGCQKDYNAFVQTAGNDLAVIFSELGVNLASGSYEPNAKRASCLVRVPAQVARGIYIGELSQRISAGVIKTARSSGSITTSSSFFNYPVPLGRLMLPRGQRIDASSGPITVERRDLFSVNTQPSWYNGWCGSNRGTKGLYQANIAIQGQRDSHNEDLLINVDSLDVKFEMQAAAVFCGR